MADKPIKKVVLAYSGGLDSSTIVKWLETEYGRWRSVTFTADLGQGEELEPSAWQKALTAGRRAAERLRRGRPREEFVRDYVFPMFRANTVYEGQYLLQHLDRPAADRQEADRDRTKNRRRRGCAWRHRQG